MSEFLGIRVAMLDAIQRYQATHDIDKKTPQEKTAIIQTLLKASCKDNGLLESDRKEVIGEAWSRLIGSRSPETIVKFIEHPKIAEMADNADKIKPQAKELTTTKAAAYVAGNVWALRSLITGFEDIAKSTGAMYRTEEGDTLSDNIAKYSAEFLRERQQTARPPKESPSAATAVREIFDNKNGKVDERYVGGAASAPDRSQNLGTGPLPATAASAAKGR